MNYIFATLNPSPAGICFKLLALISSYIGLWSQILCETKTKREKILSTTVFLNPNNKTHLKTEWMSVWSLYKAWERNSEEIPKQWIHFGKIASYRYDVGCMCFVAEFFVTKSPQELNNWLHTPYTVWYDHLLDHIPSVLLHFFCTFVILTYAIVPDCDLCAFVHLFK